MINRKIVRYWISFCDFKELCNEVLKIDNNDWLDDYEIPLVMALSNKLAEDINLQEAKDFIVTEIMIMRRQ
jgi:UDP-galactopyranose mutase